MSQPEQGRAAQPDQAMGMDIGPGESQVDQLRHLLASATQQLLGATIELSDQQWRAPSGLPGWSRGHVATHIARQADGMVRLAEWACTGHRQEMYGSPGQRDADIAAGADRPGLDLQIDLDTSAGRLTEAFDRVAEVNAWDATVELRDGAQARARMLPLGRLNEVVLHHVDLVVGFGVSDIDSAVAGWLLEWCAFRLRTRDDVPALELDPEDGPKIAVGSGHPRRTVGGSSAALLGWLTGRSGADAVVGGDGVRLPPF